MVATALDDPDPLAFLTLVSSIVAVVAPSGSSRQDESELSRPAQELFLESMVEIKTRETTAMLHGLAALVPDNRMAQQARREMRRRDHALPHWLLTLDEAEAEAAATTVDHFEDGENVVVSVVLSGGHPLTSVLYVDHASGSAAKDGFVLPTDAEGFRDMFTRTSGPAQGMRYVPIPPEEAKARIADALESGDHLYPPFESEDWLQSRPLIEWMASLLPGGGRGYVPEEMTPIQHERILERFFASPDSRGLNDPADELIAGDLIDFLGDHTVGGPLRWSPIKVEILLSDWYPRKVMGPGTQMLRMPTVLRAMIEFGHTQLGLPESATQLTLSAVDEWTPFYFQQVQRSHHPLVQEWEDPWGQGWEGYPYEDPPGLTDSEGNPISWSLHRAFELVGGEEALAGLRSEPLPDEALQLDRVPEDILDRVRATARLCDEAADALFDREIRTACRRVIAQTAAEEPAVFRRKSKDVTAAAAIVWAVATVNNRMGQYYGIDGPLAKDLAAHFGLSAIPTDRARPFLRSFGGPDHAWSRQLSFFTPEVLTGARRAELIRIRDEDTGPATY